MRFSTAALLASLAALPSAAAWGQQIQNGSEVSVNPMAGAGTTLLYPGGQYMRVVRPLLQPGETAKDMGPLQLHMPSGRAPAREAMAAPARPATPAAPRRQVAKAAPAPKRVAAAPPPAAASRAAPAPNIPGYNGGYGAFGMPPQGAAGLNLGAPSAPAPSPPPPPKQVAKAEPPPQRSAPSAADEIGPGLTKRSVILFAAGASDPAQSALGAIKFLAGDLNSAMVNAASRVQILAYGGERGDKGSDARRLSLKRALAIRQVLIDDGVPSERIDVRAMGGADDGGPADRVDVYVKA